MIIVPNHHKIVPITRDIGAEVSSNNKWKSSDFKVQLFGDSILCGRDPDLIDPDCGCGHPSYYGGLTGAVPQPPSKLLEVFLPQYRLVVDPRCAGLSTSSQLLDGSGRDQSDPWPAEVDADVVVINHGLNDARFEVTLTEYQSNLEELRRRIVGDTEVVWMLPTETKFYNTAPYANIMRQVAQANGDLIADTRHLKNWLSKLPDGTHPRQVGYSELVEICLAPVVNNALVRIIQKRIVLDTLGPDTNQRQDQQQKFVMVGDTEAQLSFTPKSASWVEVYHRDNITYRVVSRGLLDTKGILTAGIYNGITSAKLVEPGRSYNMSRIKRDRGDIIFSRTYDIYGDPTQAKNLADDLNQTNDDCIVIVSTYDEPRSNRLYGPLVEAMYRCGASEEIFGSGYFRFRSSYILVGIPGMGKGQGYEAYSGLVDATEANIAPVPTPYPVETKIPEYYSFTSSNNYWSNFLNEFGIWEKDYHATYNVVDGDNSANIPESPNPPTGAKANGVQNYALITPSFRLALTQDNRAVNAINWLSNTASTVTSVNTTISRTPDCGDLGIEFGANGTSYIEVTNEESLKLTKFVANASPDFTIETVIWPIENGGGGMIFNKDSEYEMRITADGTIMVALDWGVGADVNLPGGGWITLPLAVPFNQKTYIAWVVRNTAFDIYLNGVLSYTETGLDRANVDNGNNLFIGNRRSLSDQFRGYVLDLRIWNKALSQVEINITNKYFEFVNIPFRGGIAPILEEFKFDVGIPADDDLVIIGKNVTEFELNTYGIYKTKVDVLLAEPGDEVGWDLVFTAPGQFKMGYWMWDIGKLPDISLFSVLVHKTAPAPGSPSFPGLRITEPGSFIVPDTFTDKSIIVFGVGDVQQEQPNGFNNVDLTVSAKRAVKSWTGNYYNWDLFLPSGGEYTVEMSVDNIGNITVVPYSATLNYNTYPSAVEIVDVCTGYRDTFTGNLTVDSCGWYKIYIYAENALDLLEEPLFYGAQNTTTGFGSLLFSTYGVSTTSSTFEWDYTFSDGVIYTVEMSNLGSEVKFEIAQIGDEPLNYREIVKSSSYINVAQRSFSTAGGDYKIRISPGPGGVVAARIKNSLGKTVWSTRSIRNPFQTDYKGVAARIKDRYNRTLWTTRSSYNYKKINQTEIERVVDRESSYAEFSFEVSAHGKIIPIDRFPPRFEVLDQDNKVIELLPLQFDVIKDYPMINGTRIVNHRYYSSKVATHPEFYRVGYGNKIKFRQPMHGVVTVVSDTVPSKTQGAIEFSLENTHSLDYYRERFTPARWAPGSNVYPLGSSVFGQSPGSSGTVPSGNSAPRVANSAVITNQLLEYDSVYNAGLNFRVGDSHYAEPVILTQPLSGYARISQDRKTIDYTPFAGKVGFDSFAYTMITQHGQEGLPKNIFVRIEQTDLDTGIVVKPSKLIYHYLTDNYIYFDVSIAGPGARVTAEIRRGMEESTNVFAGNIDYARKSTPTVYTRVHTNLKGVNSSPVFGVTIDSFLLTEDVTLRYGPISNTAPFSTPTVNTPEINLELVIKDGSAVLANTTVSYGTTGNVLASATATIVNYVPGIPGQINNIL